MDISTEMASTKELNLSASLSQLCVAPRSSFVQKKNFIFGPCQLPGTCFERELSSSGILCRADLYNSRQDGQMNRASAKIAEFYSVIQFQQLPTGFALKVRICKP